MSLFNIENKNLYAETGSGTVGLGVMPSLQINNNGFVGKDFIVAGNLYVDKKIISNDNIETAKGFVDSSDLLLPLNIANGTNIKANFALATLALIY